MAADWILKRTGGKANVVELTGTPGASASIERSKGFDDAVAGQKGIKLVAQQSANFDQATAQQVMDQVIQSTGGKIDVVYISADVMALGGIAALDAITVVALGGTQLTGGVGGVVGTLIGVLFIGSLFNVFNLDATLNTFLQKVVRGALLIVVVIQGSLSMRRR